MNFNELQYVTNFGKVQTLWNSDQFDKNGLEEFVQNVILNKNMFDVNNQNGFGIMLHDLSNLYVLVSKPEFPYNKLDARHTINIPLEKSGPNSILGYIWIYNIHIVQKNSKPVYFIKFIDTRISGLQIAKYMMHKFESFGMGRMILPYEIQYSAKDYWEKYFIEKYNINNKIQLQAFIDLYHLHEQGIKWEYLFNIH